MSADFQHGLSMHKQGRLDEAAEIYRLVLAGQPNHFAALHLTGLIQYQKGVPAEAIAWYRRAIAADANAPEVYSNLGLAQQALGQHEAALASYGEALRLRPANPEALTNRGNALQELRSFANAIASYDQALQLSPSFALAHNNRGNALRSLSRPTDALAAYERALHFAPGYAQALDNRGRTLRDLKRYDEAVTCFERLVATAPTTPYAPGLMLDTRLQCCDWRNYEAISQAIVDGVGRGERVDAPFSFLSHAALAAPQLLCAKAFAAAEYPAQPMKRRPRRHGEVIRLAYASADFHEHATAYLMAELFETHDRACFEVVAISYGPDDQSPMRARLNKAFDRIVDVRDQTDRDVAALMDELEIDIAVDLKGYTADNRAGIFAHRGAPVQVAYLGFPGTMGAPFIDYVIADRQVVPDRFARHYSEKVVRLPDSYQVNDRRRRIAAVTPSRAEAGLPEKDGGRSFVFCSFNNNYKIRPAIFDVWMRLLRQVEGSVLWLLQDNAVAVANLKREAEARGVSADRLIFAARVPLDQHLARHRLADLFVDTFPYNAHTTASDALWAGLPLVTLTGETFASRVAASLLHAVGLPELVTDSLADYEALIARLATSPGMLVQYRERLESQRLKAALFDTVRFCRHIEAAYLTMHERQRRGEPPTSFDVPL
jgi:predicted O-linked N-acetylglucosamine transferase (SPINDLY family)